MSSTSTSSSYASSFGKVVRSNSGAVSISVNASAIRRGVSMTLSSWRSTPRAARKAAAACSAVLGSISLAGCVIRGRH